ncbi:MAG: sulfur carrier protein ThiS [Spirochaetales bacterium]|nr:MAG: sulfur carrier protein ThiS [Spirochaetales bacterium]
MKILLNGETADLPGDSLSVRAVLAAKGWSFPLIVVRVNGELAARDDWNDTIVSDGDVMEAIHLVSGG